MSLRILAFCILFQGLFASQDKVRAQADFVYWFPSQTVNWAIVHLQNPQDQTLKYKSIPFDWEPGFRVGFGYGTFYDAWDTQVAYTYFRSSTRDAVVGPSESVISPFICSKAAFMNPYNEAELHWKLRFNMFDWELGRKTELNKNLFVRPFIGLKGGWIYQTLDTTWRKSTDGLPVSAKEEMKNSFAGGGPQIGFGGNWMIRPTVGFFGDFSSAFMWGHWSLKDHLYDNIHTNVSANTGSRNFGSFILRTFLGLFLETAPQNKRFSLSAKIGYELQDLFNHYQLLDDETGTHSNDLILQGLTIKTAFKF